MRHVLFALAISSITVLQTRALPSPVLIASTGERIEGRDLTPYDDSHLVYAYLDWIDPISGNLVKAFDLKITSAGQSFSISEGSANWETIKSLVTNGYDDLVDCSTYGGYPVLESQFYSAGTLPDLHGFELTSIVNVVKSLDFTEIDCGDITWRHYTARVETLFYGYASHVPDGGSSALMLGFALLGVWALYRKGDEPKV